MTFGKKCAVRDCRAKYVRIIQNAWELVGMQTLQINHCKYRDPYSVICRSLTITKYHDSEMWVQTRNCKLLNTSGYFLLKKQVTKLHQRPTCFDASISSSYESILQEENFKKAILEVRLVSASTQIFTIICTPNNAICILPKVIEAKHVENIIIWKYAYIQIYKCVLTEGRKFLSCQFKINISTCCLASTNWIIVKQRVMKSQEILYSKSNEKFYVWIYIYTHIHKHKHIHPYTHIYV